MDQEETFIRPPSLCCGNGRRIDNADNVAIDEETDAAGNKALAGVKGIVDIRGHGLMIGLELDRPCGALVGFRGLDFLHENRFKPFVYKRLQLSKKA